MKPGEFDAMCEERRRKAKSKPVKSLTKADTALLRSYLKACDEVETTRPERITSEEWDEIIPYAREHGEIPPEYKGRAAMRTEIDEETGETVTHYWDEAFEQWAEKSRTLQDRYHDTIVRALKYALTLEADQMAEHPQVNDLISVLLASIEAAAPAQDDMTGGLLASAYVPMLNGALTNDFAQIKAKGATVDEFTRRATFETSDGNKVIIENYDKLQAALATSATKLLDTAVAYLTDNNFYRGRRENITPTVEIPLIEFGEACGWSLTPATMETPEAQAEENKRANNRVRAFRTSVRRDLHDISSVLWTGEETRGRNKGDYREMRLISSHSIRNGIVRINFDIDAAAYLVNAYIMQYPIAALLGTSTANAYDIGRKMALHNSIDNNHSKGTNNTLSVKALTAAATNMQGVEEWQARLDAWQEAQAEAKRRGERLARGQRPQRNWKGKIKAPLEAALDELVSVGLLSRWEYRDPKTQDTYTAEAAQSLTFPRYSRLMVDFVMVDAPDQSERRAAIAAKKEAKKDDKKRKG